MARSRLNISGGTPRRLAAVRQLLPARLQEFESIYKADARRKEVGVDNYSIQDWLLGMRVSPNIRGEKTFDDFAGVVMQFRVRRAIIQAIEARFESSLFDIHRLVQADLFDSELDAASELTKAGFLRAGGIVSGVVLEKHLKEVCNSHGITVRKKNPTIGDLNDALKEGNVVDIPVWRHIQRLTDLRNLCGHSKDREPTKDEVVELIGGCAKITKTLY